MSGTINKTGHWILRVSVASPLGDEATIAKALAPIMVARRAGYRPLEVIESELALLVKTITNEIAERVEKGGGFGADQT